MAVQFILPRDLKAGMEIIYYGARIKVLEDAQFSEGHRTSPAGQYGGVYYCKGVVIEAPKAANLSDVLAVGREWSLQGNELVRYQVA